MVKRVFSMPLRALQGFLDSVFKLANIPLVCPHYTCISRRAKDVEVSIKTKTRGAIQHLAIDATGLKVYGEGEWKVKKHGTDGKRRVWRKLHIAVDTNTHEIVAAELSLSNVTDAEVLPNLLKQTRRKISEISGDGAYDTRNCHDAIRIKRAVPLIPPREGALFKKLIKYNQWKYPNPLEAIEPIKTSEKHLAYLTKPQIEEFFDNLQNCNRAIKASIPLIIVIAKICLATGARISEALTLTRTQITELKLTYTDTKGKRNRSVPISPSLYQEILDIAVSDHDIFNTSYKDAWRYIKRALPEHLPNGQATHFLRHTFASHFMMNKGDILVLQRILILPKSI
jgi:hypothetical protein